MEQLTYQLGDRYCPQHPVQVVRAEHFLHLYDGTFQHVEGLCFDRNGDLYFVKIYTGDVMKIDMKTKQITKIYGNDDRYCASSVKIHKDGRLFVTALDLRGRNGGLFVMNADGSDFHCVLPGHNVDDLVFDSKGGYYMTIFDGKPTNRIGKVLYMSPDGTKLTSVVENLAGPNGIALSKDESILWVTETSSGNINRIVLGGHDNLSKIVYRVEGFYGPDTCSIDDDDNLYFACVHMGHVLVLNPRGFLIGKVLLPRMEEGYNLVSTCPMCRPGHKELYIISCDDEHEDVGANIFRVGSFAPGNSVMYQYQ